MQICRYKKEFQMRAKVLPILMGVIAGAIGFTVGCEGPQGPRGAGIGDVDTKPPTVDLTSPAHTDTVFTDTFTVAANASDSEGILYVEFLLDGSSYLGGDTSAVDSFPPYEKLWNFKGSGHPYGIYPIIARAVDINRNVADSAPRLVIRKPLPEQQFLSYFDTRNGEASYLTIPKSFNDNYFNIRITPPAPCRVLEMQVETPAIADRVIFGTNQEIESGCTLWGYVWNSSSETLLPTGAPLDSVEMPEASIQYDGWTTFDFRGLTLPIFEKDFHAGIAPPAGEYNTLFNANKAVPVAITVAPPLADPTKHRSQLFYKAVDDDPQQWGTMQAAWNQPTRFDLHIRVLVEYEDGTTSLLAPASDRRNVR